MSPPPTHQGHARSGHVAGGPLTGSDEPSRIPSSLRPAAILSAHGTPGLRAAKRNRDLPASDLESRGAAARAPGWLDPAFNSRLRAPSQTSFAWWMGKRTAAPGRRGRTGHGHAARDESRARHAQRRRRPRPAARSAPLLPLSGLPEEPAPEGCRRDADASAWPGRVSLQRIGPQGRGGSRGTALRPGCCVGSVMLVRQTPKSHTPNRANVTESKF